MISVTILVENTARGSGVLGEHGLACWVDTGAHRVLFDTGQGMALLNNAHVLRIGLEHADAIVLSHGHYDHVGGLEAALGVARRAPVFMHPRATEPKFTRQKDRLSGADSAASSRRISLPFIETREFLHDERDVLVSREPCEVVPGVWMTGEIPRTNNFEDTGGPFFLDAELTQADPLLDDQALFFTAQEGVAVVLGCAHAGVVNTLDHVAKLTGRSTIHTVMGGMHLERASARRMAETFAALDRFEVQNIVPLHCTGDKARAAFRNAFGERCLAAAAGAQLEFRGIEP
jgi:7,8-dihydropterin-6-yl-methyl-4-(beta-D-ribofuranosyl)aminobenzene 5'-phosphate synthase